jgi:hypothetical protein
MARQEDDQTAWVRLARDCRASLAERAKKLADMEPEAAGQFIDACREALAFHQDAMTFDKNIELELARVVFGDSAG